MGSLVHLQLVRYHFTEIHPLPQLPHGNSKGSTPYKRQTPSTKELLQTAVETNKPKEACRNVEVILEGIESNEISSSVLLHNKQQASTIRRQLFQSQCNSDPITVLVDMHKTEFTDFIRSLQILPSPTCVLATDVQLQELVKNCTLPGKFGIMHLDPTFNLGNFFVTPIVFPLITYIHKKNKCPPTLIGPVLIHHPPSDAVCYV